MPALSTEPERSRCRWKSGTGTGSSQPHGFPDEPNVQRLLQCCRWHRLRDEDPGRPTILERLDLETEAVPEDGGSLGDIVLAEVGHQSAHGVDILAPFDSPVEDRLETADGQLAGNLPPFSRGLDRAFVPGVELILYFTDDQLEDILEGHEAR